MKTLKTLKGRCGRCCIRLAWDEHDEDEPLALLKVKLPSHIKAHKTESGYEHQVFDHIPPEHITVHNKNF